MGDSVAKQFTAGEVLRAALARALSWGAREVRFGEDGISLHDALGSRRELKRFGAAFKARPAELSELLGSNDYRNWDSWKSAEEERVIDGLGPWLEALSEDALVLKPKKPRAPCLDALVEPADDGLSRIRSLYRRGGVDVFLLVEGDTRARDVALAIAAERRMLGLPTSVEFSPERPRTWRGEAAQEQQYGPDVFDEDHSEAGEPWKVVQADAREMVELFLAKDDPEGSRVFVAASDRYHSARFLRAQKQLDERSRAAAIATVTLEKSKPVLRTLFQKDLFFGTTADRVFAEAPWDIHAARKAAREKSRRLAPKTWHPTSEAVAEAFVAREAPRGYVSGKNLYFHGPVAFSCYDRNPVAAIVDLPGGRPAVFFGRDEGIGGSMSGTVSMAQSDVRQAARAKGFLMFEADRLTEFLSIGDRQLDEIAFTMRNKKNEAEFPSSCRIDRRKLKAFLARKHGEAMDEVEAAFRTEFPTYRRASAYRGLQMLAEKRDRLAGLLGASLPDIGSAEEYRVWADAEQEAADRRQAEFRDRRKAAPEPQDEEGEAPAPSM